jgi:hypothetical protein
MKANREFKYLLPLDDEIADGMKPVSKPFPMPTSDSRKGVPRFTYCGSSLPHATTNVQCNVGGYVQEEDTDFID